MKTWLERQQKAKERTLARKDNRAFQDKFASKPRKPSMATMRKRVKAIRDRIVFKRDFAVTGGKCRICMVRPATLGYHLIPVCEAKGMEFDLDNVVAGCHNCNFGECHHRLEYRRKHREILGTTWYDGLEFRAAAQDHIPRQLRVSDLLEMEAKYQEIYQQMVLG